MFGKFAAPGRLCDNPFQRIRMVKEIKLPEALLEFIAGRPGAQWHQIRSEASQRRFFRFSHGKINLVAMIYPQPSRSDVQRFLAMHHIYRNHGLRVPAVHDVLADQVVLQEDAGDLLLQKAWRERAGSERQCLLCECREILDKLALVPSALASAKLDPARQKWEMDFFLKHFFPRYPIRGCSETGLRESLMALVGKIDPECVFAHRDFHSRNLLVKGRSIVMVDLQDSLLAPRFYDLVSLAYDSYLDLGAAREVLWSGREYSPDERRQMRLTALQRNIKALGTFAFQIHENRHPAYGRYIPRTLRHICSHLQKLGDPDFRILYKYFSAL